MEESMSREQANDETDADLHFVTSTMGRLSSGFFAADGTGLGVRERRMFGAWLVYTEVDNGGFELFFRGRSADLVRDAFEGLETIGASIAASILRAAAAQFPEGWPAESHEERTRQLDALRAAGISFAAADQDFYARAEDIVALLAQFLRAEPLG
jgi:hypothetical protein